MRSGLREELAAAGRIEGSGMAIEARFAHGHFERLPDLARELIRLPVDVLVTVVTQASIAAKDATKTIPIVRVDVSDPVAAGLVANLSRPGGNVTGASAMSSETAGKWLQLLKESIPGARRVAVLWNPANHIFQTQLIRQTEIAAQSFELVINMQTARRLG